MPYDKLLEAQNYSPDTCETSLFLPCVSSQVPEPRLNYTLSINSVNLFHRTCWINRNCSQFYSNNPFILSSLGAGTSLTDYRKCLNNCICRRRTFTPM